MSAGINTNTDVKQILKDVQADYLEYLNVSFATPYKMMYAGMGYYIVVYRLNDDKKYFFKQMMGGSNGYDVENNYRELKKITRANVTILSWNQCLSELTLDASNYGIVIPRLDRA